MGLKGQQPVERKIPCQKFSKGICSAQSRINRTRNDHRITMKFKKFAPVAAILSLRDAQRASAKKPNKNRPLEFFADELEKRQLLATFSYSSGLLTVQTNSTNEQLSIISRSESGRYTMTSTGTWSGIPVSGLSNTSIDTYVNQSSGLASFLLDDRRYHSRKYGLFYWLHPRGPDWPKISCYG